MGKFRVEISEGCISCALCASDCPEIFEMKDVAIVKQSVVEDPECAKSAGENCPVNVLHVTNVETNEKLI